MSTIIKLKYKVSELKKYVEENTQFSVEIRSTKYPVSISFYENKIDLFSEEITDTVPLLCFVFADEMSITTTEDFKISEAVFNKLKNLSKEINRLYLHSFREEIERTIVPMWDTIDGSQVCFYRKSAFDQLMKPIDIKTF